MRATGGWPRPSTRCHSIPCRHAPGNTGWPRVEFRWWLACEPICSPPLRQRCRCRKARRRLCRARVQKVPEYSRVSTISSQATGSHAEFTRGERACPRAWSGVLLFSAVDIVDAKVLYEMEVPEEQHKQSDLVLHRLPVNLKVFLDNEPPDIAGEGDPLDFFRRQWIDRVVEHEDGELRAPAGGVIKEVLAGNQQQTVFDRDFLPGEAH